MYKNYWLGANELQIVFRDGTHRVIEEYENWKTVFTGTYEECVKYCEKRYTEYEEDILL